MRGTLAAAFLEVAILSTYLGGKVIQAAHARVIENLIVDIEKIELFAHAVDTGEPPYCYLIAQTLLASDMNIPEASPFATAERCGWRRRSAVREFPLDTGDEVIYSGLGWIGDRWRDIVSRCTSAGYRIIVEDVGEFTVSSNGDRVCLTERAAGTARITLVESVLGPPLILALALKGKFCLHAGAVVLAGKGVIFVAESGYGKSTLARFVGARVGAAGQRMSDDILPLRLGPSPRLLALPHFPQLKLASSDQPLLHVAVEVPVHTIYFLDKEKAKEEGGIAIRPMTKRESTLGLVANTVAARLFDQKLLANHFAFCAEAAAKIRARRLYYPRKLDMLPVVEQAILADLAQE